MVKYVPEFIYDKYEEGLYEGSFSGYSLFFDIKDFTHLTESLIRQGQKGAESINRMLEVVFTPVIEAIERCGGFVTGFAGDAFMAVFDITDSDNILSIYSIIKKELSVPKKIEYLGSEFRIDARLTIGCGEIKWMILRNKFQNEYFFYGSGIADCNAYAELKRDLAFSDKAAKTIGYSKFKFVDNVYEPFEDEIAAISLTKKKYRYSESTKQSFLIDYLHNYKAENEIRDVSTIFIYLDRIKLSELQTVISDMEMLAGRYNAFFNKLDYSDKGLLGIVIFGAPRKFEKTLDRMMYFVMELAKVSCDIKLGISSGRVYAGYTGTSQCHEYTILGYPPNLASRLMSKAEIGETLVDIFSYEQLLNRYNFLELGKISMKGFVRELPVYKFVCEKRNIEDTGASNFCGRERELERISEGVLSKEKDTWVIYIHGEPGQGKSRLIKELRKRRDTENLVWCYLLCDGILYQPYVPIIRFLKEYFEYDGQQDDSYNLEHFRSLWRDFANNEEELIRIESIIGQLLGIRWQGSIWELLPPEARPLQERKALVNFFEKISEDKKLILQIEDGQWIDRETLEFIRLFVSSGVINPKILICCRYNTDGSKIDYQLGTANSEHLELESLPEEESEIMVRNLLGIEKLPGKTRKFILGKGQGNPLYLEQITLYLQEEKYLDEAGNLLKDVDIVTAFGITDIIGARIDNLAEEIRTLVYYASVLGVEFDIPVLSAMLNHELDKEAEEVVHNCIWIRLRELHYIFSQILVRDTAYNRLLREKQKKLNFLAAESYQKIYPGKQLLPYHEIVGLHYEQAGHILMAASNYNGAFFKAYRDLRFNKALALAKKINKLSEEVTEPDELSIARSYNNLGLVYFALGEYRKSLEYNIQALMIFEMKDVKLPLILALLNNTGNAYSILGEYDRALEYHSKSALLRSIHIGAEHPDYAQSVMHMGNAYLHKGKYEEALEHYQKALEIFRKCEEEEPGKLVSCYNNMGAFYLQTGQYETALDYLNSALPILQAHDALDKPRAASLFRQIGNAYEGMNEIELSLDNLNKALEIEEKIYGKNHPQTANTYDYMGRVFLKKNDKEKALEYLYLALNIYSEHYGDNHPAIGHVHYNLGKCYYFKEDHSRAKECLSKSKEILQNFAQDNEILKEVEELLTRIDNSDR
jgi:tetratricopeptide (TPR) repeat protein